MMDQNNNSDDIDKMLFSYFDNNKDIPSSTQDTILNAFEKPRKTISLVYKIQKVAIVLISFIIITTSVVFAKDIINFITSLFTNTTEGINKAIENGYVQNIDMDFVYDNNIGIKVDYLVMDDTNLDVSFVYDYKGKEKVESIGIYEYIIRDEENNLIYYYFENNNKMNTGKCISNTAIRTASSNHCRESILYQSYNFPNTKSLIFEIVSIKFNNSKIIGNWIFNINLTPKDNAPQNNTYLASYNKYINKIDTYLDETSLNIEIKLNTEINKDLMLIPNNYFLKNYSNQYYPCLFIKSNNHEENNNIYGTLSLKYDLSKYHDNSDLLKLYIKIDHSKELNINLYKNK